MGLVLITVKAMPESPSTDLASVRKGIEEAMKKQGATSVGFEEKPVAFGLKALFTRVSIDESKGSEVVENEISKVNGVSSVTVEDYRRVLG